MDRDALLSIALGLVLLGVGVIWKWMEVGDIGVMIVDIIVEGARSLIIGLGMLFLVVGILLLRE